MKLEKILMSPFFSIIMLLSISLYYYYLGDMLGYHAGYMLSKYGVEVNYPIELTIYVVASGGFLAFMWILHFCICVEKHTTQTGDKVET
jgi:hypothetical protein